MAGLFDRERIIARPGFNRWLVPQAARAIHLSSGMAYGFSVFWLPLSKAIGVTQPVPCGAEVGFFGQLVTTTCDWKISMLGWMYSLFFFFLGSSAAIFGGWLEKVGPRRAGVVAAFCWGGVFFISALGIKTHQLWLMWLGSGVIGGCGLGLGYISPVSSLIKWFPDPRGMASVLISIPNSTTGIYFMQVLQYLKLRLSILEDPTPMMIFTFTASPICMLCWELQIPGRWYWRPGWCFVPGTKHLDEIYSKCTFPTRSESSIENE